MDAGGFLRLDESWVSGKKTARLGNLKMQHGEIETFPQTANSNLSTQPFSTSSHDEQLRCLEILSTTDTTTAHGGHDHVPTHGDRVLVFPNGVVLGQAVLQESLWTQFGLGLPYSDEYYEGNLQIRIPKLSIVYDSTLCLT